MFVFDSIQRQVRHWLSRSQPGRNKDQLVMMICINCMISSFMFLMPDSQRDSWSAFLMTGFLGMTLIINTLMLYLFSRLPQDVVAFKSLEIEEMGKRTLLFLQRGFKAFAREVLILVFQGIDYIIESCRTSPSSLVKMSS